LHHVDRLNDEFIGETYLPRRRAEGAYLIGITGRLYAPNGEVRAKRPSIDLVAEHVATHFDVVMQQLETRLGSTPIHTTWGRRKFGKAPTPLTRTSGAA
jgi:hypothetical protein